MKSRLLLFVAVSLCIVPGAASIAADVDDSWYMGVAAGAMRYQQDNLEDYELSDYRLMLGKNINRNFAVEAHAGVGGDDSRPVYGLPVSLSVDYYLAGFVKANMTFDSPDWGHNRLRLYGMLGGTYIETTSSDPVTTRSGSQGSVSAGVGVEMFVDNIGIQLGYTRYIHGSHNNVDYSLDSAYLGVVYEFEGM